jgi:hypothetical protein
MTSLRPIRSPDRLAGGWSVRPPRTDDSTSWRMRAGTAPAAVAEPEAESHGVSRSSARLLTARVVAALGLHRR